MKNWLGHANMPDKTNATLDEIFGGNPESRIADTGNAIRKTLSDSRGVLVFGAGNNGRRIASLLPSQGCPVLGFIDEVAENQGKLIADLPVHSLEAASQLYGPDVAIVVSIFNPAHSFVKTRKKLGLHGWTSLSIFHLCLLYPDTFLPFYSAGVSDAILQNRQTYETLYRSLVDDRSKDELIAHLKFRLFADFDALPDPIGLDFAHIKDRLADDIAFIDGGAFDGDSIQAFLKVAGDRFASIVAYEPDSRNFSKLSAFCQSLPPSVRDRIGIRNKGVWSHGGRIGFNETSTPGSSFHPEAVNTVEVVSLDEDIQLESAAFIKLDVEGAEMASLHGARNIIQRGEAIFSIAVYHEPDDLWKIPQLIEQYNEHYRFGLRSHGYDGADLMLYAFPA
ncbi:FkbM family methyltransferase [Massilia suwonensis]|uniref:FkbM family methyltransferase n=1 Tax=Massilia suwonensis TaxID=648895 RepID=A0ABW0MIR3_9BURK